MSQYVIWTNSDKTEKLQSCNSDDELTEFLKNNPQYRNLPIEKETFLADGVKHYESLYMPIDYL